MKIRYLLIILILLILPSVFGLSNSGFFVSDDGNWMVIRFSAFYEALRGGQFPVRFLPRLYFGFGYPVADFLYPMFMYLGVPIKLIGFGFVNTIKIIFGLSMLLSGIFSFLWLRKIFSEFSSIVGSMVYTLFPYHLWDLYKRGSVGEIITLSIVPFVLWQIEERNITLISIGISLIIISHNTLALLFIPVVVLYGALRKVMSMRKFVITSAIGLSLASFFWIPALYDQQFTVFGMSNVSDFFSYFNWNETMPLIGISGFIAIIGGLYAYIKKRNVLLLFFILLSICSIFFSLPVSEAFWRIIPGRNLIQFPFRILSLTALATAFLIANLINLGNKSYVFIGIVIIGVAYYASWQFLFPKKFQYYPDSYYSTNLDSTTVKNEYLPIWYKPQNKTVALVETDLKSQNLEIYKGRGSIIEKSRGTNVQAQLNLLRFSIVRLNFLYFPGWEVELDGKKIPIQYKKTGIITFTVPKGTHVITAFFGETKVRLIADILTILSLISIIFYEITKKRYE